MRIEYDRLRLYEKAIFLALLLIFICRIFLYGGMQQLDYFDYLIHKNSYTCVNAMICGENTQSVEIAFIRGSFGFISEKSIQYEIDGIMHIGSTKMYNDYENNENIVIAINNNNPKKIKRCIPYKKETTKDNVNPILISICISACIFFIFNKLVLLWRKYIDSKTSLTLLDEQVKKQETESLQKKEYILSLLKEVACNEELINKLEISVNDDFVWCLTKLSKTYVADNILLLNISENKEYEFVTETMKLRQQGLPKEYYVIAKVENNYLCGRADMDRLYCFSHALGITNTSYATIYDYIIEQIDKR